MTSERVVKVHRSLEVFADWSKADDENLLKKLKLFRGNTDIELVKLLRGNFQERTDFKNFLVFNPKGCQLDETAAGYTMRLLGRLSEPSVNGVVIATTAPLTIQDLRDLSDPELAVLCRNNDDVRIIRKLFGRTPASRG